MIWCGLTRFVGNIIQVTLIINILIVDGGWKDAVMNGQRRKNRFNTTCGTQKVSGHGFGGTDRQLIGMVFKHGFDRTAAAKSSF